jgi:hypothetical protein
MPTQTDHPTQMDETAALNGIVALLAASGLNDDQITAVTGRDASEVQSAVADAAPPARELSVIDRARMHMLARAKR